MKEINWQNEKKLFTIMQMFGFKTAIMTSTSLYLYKGPA